MKGINITNGKSVAIVVTLFICFSYDLTSATADDALPMEGAVALAIKNSNQIISAKNEVDSARSQIQARKSGRHPQLNIEARYYHISEVPSLTFQSGQNMDFGDHESYSVGPVVTWNILDFGKTKSLIKSAEESHSSKENEAEWLERQVILATRLSYLKSLLTAEQLELIRQSLKLAENQHKDIRNRARAGSASRIDLLSASKEVNNLTLQARQLSTDHANSLEDLLTVIGRPNHLPTSSSLKLDSLSDIRTKLFSYLNLNTNSFDAEKHPLILSVDKSARATLLAAKSQRASGYPHLTLFAKSSLEYPNGPTPEEIHQNMAGVNLTIPIYEGGRSSYEHREKVFLANSLENKKRHIMRNLTTSYKKNLEQLATFRENSKVHAASVKEAEEKASLVYKSYLSGKLSFLEVQNANLQHLESKMQSTFNEIQIYMLAAELASFTGENK